MSDPNPERTKTKRRFAMSEEELVASIAGGNPGSPDWEHGVAELQARTLLTTSRLVDETARLRRATWAMAVATFAIVVVTLVVALLD
jgi:hypothetical protein